MNNYSNYIKAIAERDSYKRAVSNVEFRFFLIPNTFWTFSTPRQHNLHFAQPGKGAAASVKINFVLRLSCFELSLLEMIAVISHCFIILSAVADMVCASGLTLLPAVTFYIFKMFPSRNKFFQIRGKLSKLTGKCSKF